MTSKFLPFRTELACVVLVSAFFAPAARAGESANAAAAQGLFDDAKALMASGRAAEACPKFEESQRLDPGSGTLINLAKCYEDTGRIASAWSTYLEAASAASAAGNADREKGARERAAALAPRVSRLVIEVSPDARVPGLEIRRDKAPVGAPQWGVAVPTDPGEHTVEATAPGHEPWRSVAVVKGDGKTEHVAVPKLIGGATTEKTESATTDQGSKSSGLGAQRIAALVSGGVGVAGFVVGTVFGVKAMSDKSDADKGCNGNTCSTEEAASAGNSAHTAGNVATVGMIVGAVGVAGGLALWFTAPKERPATEVGVGLGTVALRGTW